MILSKLDNQESSSIMEYMDVSGSIYEVMWNYIPVQQRSLQQWK
jgi:hypothetical protein